jgi:uncharacterized membrane protein
MNGNTSNRYVRLFHCTAFSRRRNRFLAIQKAQGGKRIVKIFRKGFHALLAAVFSAMPLLAQTQVAPTFQGAVTDITSIAVAAGTLVAGLVGLVGLGRTAWKLSNGDPDAMTSLLMAIVAIVLGFLANTFM